MRGYQKCAHSLQCMRVNSQLPAGWWTTAGLVLSLVGVVLLFRYGMPYRVRTRGQPIRVAISSDPRAATLERRYEMLGWLGLFLVVLGTICQISENLQHWKYPEPSGIHNSCHEPTYAVQQSLLMMFQRRLSCVGWIGSHHFLRSVHNSW